MAERLISAIGGSWMLLQGLRQLRRGRTRLSLLVGAGGGLLTLRGVRGQSRLYRLLGVASPPPALSHPFSRALFIQRSITIGKPVEEVYRFCRDFENLACVAGRNTRIQSLGDGRFIGCTCNENGQINDWDLAFTTDRRNELLQFRARSEMGVSGEGSVEFLEAGRGRGCVVVVSMLHHRPGGVFGALLAKIRRRDAAGTIAEQLQRMKQVLETGEIATGQSTSGRDGWAMLQTPQRPSQVHPGSIGDVVGEASEESFPASDPPSWSRTTV